MVCYGPIIAKEYVYYTEVVERLIQSSNPICNFLEEANQRLNSINGGLRKCLLLVKNTNSKLEKEAG